MILSELETSSNSCKLLRFCDINSIHRASILTLYVKEELALAYSWSRLCAFPWILILNGIKVLENAVGKKCTKSVLLLTKVNWKLLKQASLVVSLGWLNLSKLVRTLISMWWQWAYEQHWIWWFRKFVIWTPKSFRVKTIHCKYSSNKFHFLFLFCL